MHINLASTVPVQQVNTFTQFMPVIIMSGVMVIFYVFIVRPQKQKQKDLYDQISKMSKGDSILTSGGIKCEVVDMLPGEPFVLAEVSKDVKIRVHANCITKVY